ncbi:MAG: LiaF transmembrane domain-containing protein [Paludibacteraceae bacterium]
MTKDRRFPWGISLLVFGFMYLLRQLGVFSPEVDDLIFDFRNILLVLGVIFLLTYRNKSIGIILTAVWALFYLKDIIIWSRNLSDFIWPILLIAAGVLLLLSSVKLTNGNNDDSGNENNDATKMQ